MPEFRSKRVLQLCFPARAAELKRIREAMRESLGGCGCSAKSTADIVLAIDEAARTSFATPIAEIRITSSNSRSSIGAIV